MADNEQPENQPTEETLGEARSLIYDAPSPTEAFPAGKVEGNVERRHAKRLKYAVAATLEPVSSGPEDVRVVTRDADARGTGFVSSGELPEGSRAVLHLPDDEGRMQRIECRVRRSRELGNGLFEGSVEFLGEQPQFSDTRIRPTMPAKRR